VGYFDVMSVVVSRELRQRAAELVRRVEAGEKITITVAGRPSARLVPVPPRAWRPWGDLAELFNGPEDTARAKERDRVDGELREPEPA
jgi:prevent-host-death family protein